MVECDSKDLTPPFTSDWFNDCTYVPYADSWKWNYINPSKFLSALQSYCPRLSVILLSYDSRSTPIRLDRRNKIGRGAQDLVLNVKKNRLWVTEMRALSKSQSDGRELERKNKDK